MKRIEFKFTLMTNRKVWSLEVPVLLGHLILTQMIIRIQILILISRAIVKATLYIRGSMPFITIFNDRTFTFDSTRPCSMALDYDDDGVSICSFGRGRSGPINFPIVIGSGRQILALICRTILVWQDSRRRFILLCPRRNNVG